MANVQLRRYCELLDVCRRPSTSRAPASTCSSCWRPRQSGGSARLRHVNRFEAEKAAYRERLEQCGLERFSDRLTAMARPSVRLVADTTLPVTTTGSRLGGDPVLPAAVPWPMNRGKPLSLVAQVNLADVAPFDAEAVLPRDGVLSFFYDAVAQDAWGFDPADHGSAKVVYTPARVAAQPRRPPAGLPDDGVFPPVALRPCAELTFAPYESFDVARLEMNDDEALAYAQLCESGVGSIHRLLGHPDCVQSDLRVECQLVTNGMYCGDITGYEDPRAAVLLGGAAQWRLLLQIDSQVEAAMMWADAGCLYYWIRQSDLLSRDWDQTWLILECG